MMGRQKIALRALRNVCAFIGAIALFSYFYNWAVDLRHWYVTVGSAFACCILWLGFCMIEARGGVTQVALGLARLRVKSMHTSEFSSATEPQAPIAEVAALPNDPSSASTHADTEARAPNSLPWLDPVPPLRKAAGKP
jgi:hypothetical protein